MPSWRRLEYAEGKLYANIWSQDAIVRIGPGSSKVEAVSDARNLLQATEKRGVDVLNGIAWDAKPGPSGSPANSGRKGSR